jgi:hypothetical protein
MTPDVEASKSFYSDLLGWSYDAAPMGEQTYWLIKKGEQHVGGVMSLAAIKKEGVPPHWMAYVSVPDVDEAAAAVKSGGGMVAAGPMDVPNMGRFAVLGDPQHAYSSAWYSLQGDSEVTGPPGVGTFCWDQLNTTDLDGAKAFYSKVYGWTDAPFAGSDEMSVFKAGDTAVASVMKAPEGVPAHWLSYVVVEDLAASRAKATELGGKVMVESIEVPTVGTIAVISDNVGAMIGLFQPPAQ